MANKNEILVQLISDKLRLIQAQELQRLAEDMALLTCPDRFDGRPLIRQGRNVAAQTTKGWPDAYVATGLNTVDGIEATRDKVSWEKHLKEDLIKANGKNHPNLTGYFFVGGNPAKEIAQSRITHWTNEFISYGIEAKNIQILIGKHLVIELANPKYAKLRQDHLGINPENRYFENSFAALISSRQLGLFHPTKDDFMAGLVYKPAITESLIIKLVSQGSAYVIGYGACGKTTLAQSISYDHRISHSPIYILDLARLSENVSNGDIANEMLNLTGQNVLFVIDNTHADESRANYLLQFWKDHCKVEKARILIMGRRTTNRQPHEIGHLRPEILTVTESDILGIVECLYRQNDKAFAEIPRDTLVKWVNTFGGSSRQPSENGVDLVAFSAAVYQRSEYLLKGDWRLSAKDAVTAVRRKYLEKIDNIEDRANLLRIAALGEYEIPIPYRALPSPGRGLNRLREVGLVLEYEQNISLVHAALGALLLSAASMQPNDARVSAAKTSAPLCCRMLTRCTGTEEKLVFETVLAEHLKTDEWMAGCESLNDIGTVFSVAIRTGIGTREYLDEQISKSIHLINAFIATRTLETITSFAGRLRLLGLTKSTNDILSELPISQWEHLKNTLLQASAVETLGFLKNVVDPSRILKKISNTEWNDAKLNGKIDWASAVSQLCRYLDKFKYAELAKAPAYHYTKNVTLAGLRNSDLGDISNIVRFANDNEKDLNDFFDKINSIGWLRSSFIHTRQGQICGALMSFNNTIGEESRKKIFDEIILQRVDAEFMVMNETDPRSVARLISLIGAAAALWGDQFIMRAWVWPHRFSVQEVYLSRAPNEGGIFIGMYELEFWSGIRWLSEKKKDTPASVDAAFGNSFLDRLRISPTPTTLADAYKTGLMQWTENLQNRLWKIH